MAKRVMIFIDGSNMYHNLRTTFKKASINYLRLSQKLTGDDRELIRTYYYNCPLDQKTNPEGYKSQQRFFDSLRKTPYLELRLGRLQRQDDGSSIEKGVDVKIAVDMITKAYKNQYDVAILISGDADFGEVVQEVKEQAKHVELAVFPGQPCRDLRQHCDRVITLDEGFLEDCWYK